MKTGKMKLAMGLQKSPANPKNEQNPQQRVQHQSPSHSSGGGGGAGNKPQKGAVFSRSFGVYFPRSSAQVQPRPPDVAELIHLVEELRERESRLRTELLEQKLLKESVAILPILESEISRKDLELNKSGKKIECLEAENESLRQEVEMLHLKLTEQKQEYEIRIKDFELQMVNSVNSSQRFQQLMDISGKSSMIKSLKRGHTFANIPTNRNNNDIDTKCYTESNSKESILLEIDNLPRLSRCDSIDMTLNSVIEARSRVPRVPKPPPRPSTSSSSLSSSGSSNSSLSSSADRALAEQQPPAPPPPPPNTKRAPPPPPPPPRTAAAIKTDVETQGDFIRFLIKEVENASFTDIEDVVPFVKWLDDELSYLIIIFMSPGLVQPPVTTCSSRLNVDRFSWWLELVNRRFLPLCEFWSKSNRKVFLTSFLGLLNNSNRVPFELDMT
ncbi:Actin-binding FH2 [Artemisia annua]|uniref:Actin-binding FH2 n=1 Tax=Artemisia annua TaxID=35608 RepID=A0A2U1KEN0_ARTAN|nr:Actin-binding FH2 [Artemisia annua]